MQIHCFDQASSVDRFFFGWRVTCNEDTSLVILFKIPLICCHIRSFQQFCSNCSVNIEITANRFPDISKVLCLIWIVVPTSKSTFQYFFSGLKTMRYNSREHVELGAYFPLLEEICIFAHIETIEGKHWLCYENTSTVWHVDQFPLLIKLVFRKIWRYNTENSLNNILLLSWFWNFQTLILRHIIINCLFTYRESYYFITIF